MTLYNLARRPYKLPNTGMLRDFFEVKSSPDVVASVLCLADVEDMYDVEYDQGISFTVYLHDGREIVFRRREDKLYVGNMEDWAPGNESNMINCTWADVYTTHDGATVTYTKKQRRCADEAWDLIKNAGYLSLKEAKELVQDNNLNGIKLTTRDVERAFQLYGTPASYLKGRLTQKKIARVPVDESLKDPI